MAYHTIPMACLRLLVVIVVHVLHYFEITANETFSTNCHWRERKKNTFNKIHVPAIKRFTFVLFLSLCWCFHLDSNEFLVELCPFAYCHSRHSKMKMWMAYDQCTGKNTFRATLWTRMESSWPLAISIPDTFAAISEWEVEGIGYFSIVSDWSRNSSETRFMAHQFYILNCDFFLHANSTELWHWMPCLNIFRTIYFDSQFSCTRQISEYRICADYKCINRHVSIRLCDRERTCVCDDIRIH